MRPAPIICRLFVKVIGGVLLACAGCAGSSSVDTSDAGKSASYQPGTTSFDIEALPVRAEVESGIDLFISVPPPSLTFTRVSDGFRALFEITARLTGRETGAFVGEFSWAETTLVTQYALTQRFEPIILSKRLLVAPGQFAVEVTLEDLSNGQRATRAQALTVVDPMSGLPATGRLFLQSKRPDGKFVPQVSFHVPARAESLRCAVDVYNIEPGEQIPVDIQILRFRADTTAALPPYTYSVMARPMGYGVVNLDRPDTVLRSAKIVAVKRKKQTLLFYLPALAEGLYRFDIQVTTANPRGVAAETSLVASRFYSFKGSSFPRPTTLTELVDASAYVATDKEMKDMTSATTPEDQRRRFESFWLNLVEDKNAAASLIKRYYSRVEEANRLFTTVREGWRTDRGLIYIILGPPGEITTYLDTQTWYYRLPGSQAVNTYTFKRILKFGEGLTVEEYVLDRRTYYEIFWDRAVAKWRSGETF